MESDKRNRTVMVSALIVFVTAVCVLGYAVFRLYLSGLAADLNPGGDADWVGWMLLLGSGAVALISGIVALIGRSAVPRATSVSSR